MHRLEVLLLGSFRVVLNGEPVTRFGADTARALLAYLVLRAGTPCRRESLASLLWPDQPESQARNNLRTALSRVRAAIGDRDAPAPLLLVTPDAVQFNREGDHRLDVAQFDDLIVTCRAHNHRRIEACRACAGRLEKAVDLYRGELLAGFSVASGPFEEWLTLERERRHREVLDALQHLAAYYEGRREYGEAQRFAHRQLELEPWREVAHRQLMRTSAISGQRSAALAQYESCSRALAEELGVGPEEETEALYDRIRDGDALETLASTPRHNLTAALAPLIGREAEMAAIAERLADPDCRLLSITGPGGIGKTRLALETATESLSGAHGDRFEDGVFFVPLAPLQSVEAVAPTVARAMGFSPYGSGDPRQQLLDYLREKGMFLILDGFEHLLEGVHLVLDILRVAPRVKVIVTSRARLRARSEYLLKIPGMSYPQEGVTAPSQRDGSPAVMRYDSVKLFIHSLSQARPNYEPTAEELTHIAQICRLVQGMPLAILLAASWIQVLPLSEIASQIRASMDFLEADVPDLPERQRSLRAVFDHSWGLLDERQRERFAGLSVFRGGFTLQAAQEVAGVSLRELMALVNRSLVSLTREGRYEVHELLRQYAAEKLAASPVARGTMQERHCAYFVGVLRRWEDDLKGPRQLTALAELDDEIDNARAAWDWAVESVQVKDLSVALDGLCRYYEWRARYEEGAKACSLAADSLVGTTSNDGLRLLVKTLAWQSLFALRLGQAELVSELLQRARGILEAPALAGEDTRSERAWILVRMIEEAVMFGAISDTSYAEQTLALYRELGYRWETAGLLVHFGYMAEARGAFGEAKRLFEESLTLRRHLGDRRGMAASLLGLSEIAWVQGRFAEAKLLAREVIAISRETGDRDSMASGFGALGQAQRWSGEFSQAQASLTKSLAIFQDLGDRAWISRRRGQLAIQLTMLGYYDQARVQAEAGLTLARESAHLWGIADSLQVLCYLALGDAGSLPGGPAAYMDARSLAHEWMAACREIGPQYLLISPLAASTVVALGLGDRTEARRFLCEATRIAAQTESFPLTIRLLPAMALLLADHGEAERAVELYAVASRYGYVANSRWYEDVFGRRIAAAAASLPPDVVAAAEERGRQRDLNATIKELLVELEG